MHELIEQDALYGCGRVTLTATASVGGLYLNQNSADHDHCMHIQVSSIEGIERLEAILAQAKQQLRSRQNSAREGERQELLV